MDGDKSPKMDGENIRSSSPNSYKSRSQAPKVGSRLRTSEGYAFRRSGSGKVMYDAAVRRENKFSLLQPDGSAPVDVPHARTRASVVASGDSFSLLVRNPSVSWPTVVLFLIAIALKWVAVVFVLDRSTTFGVVLSAFSSYLLFTVVHDCVHGAFCRSRRVTAVVGRLATFFLTPLGAYSSFKVAHLMHHHYVNDPRYDPDIYSAHWPGPLLPLAWMSQLGIYGLWYIRNLRELPWEPLMETLASFLGYGTLFYYAYYASPLLWFHRLLYGWLVSSVVAAAFLSLSFDWLPHHSDSRFKASTRDDRYHTAALVRVLGDDESHWAQRILDLCMLYQTDHLVHHLWPTVPWFRYRALLHEKSEELESHTPYIRRLL